MLTVQSSWMVVLSKIFVVWWFVLYCFISPSVRLYAPFFWEGLSPWLPRAIGIDDLQAIKNFTRFRTTANKQPAAFALVLDHFCRLPVFHRVDAEVPLLREATSLLFHAEQGSESLTSLVSVFPFFATIGLGYKSFFDDQAGHEVQPSMTMVEGAGDEVYLSHSNNRLLKVGGNRLQCAFIWAPNLNNKGAVAWDGFLTIPFLR